MDKDFMLHYFNKAVQSEWEKLLKTQCYQQTVCKRDTTERESFQMLSDGQKRKYLDWSPQLHRQKMTSQKPCI